MKIWSALVLFALLLTGCGSDEFDDTRLLEGLSGGWYIDVPYKGITVDGDYSRIVPVDYPEYLLEISPKGEASISLLNESEEVYEVIHTGTVTGISGKKIRFDEDISYALKTIGFFEADTHQVFSIIRKTCVSLDINYTFKNSSGEMQDEGFLMYKIGIACPE